MTFQLLFKAESFSNLNETSGSDSVDNSSMNVGSMDDDNDAEMEDAAVASASSANGNANRSAIKSSSSYTLHAHKVRQYPGTARPVTI